MVAIQSRLDDVLLATKGKKVEATHKVRRTIPAMCTPNGRSRPVWFDVSEEGERELEKLDKKYRETLLSAGEIYGKVKDKVTDVRTDARAAMPKKKPAAGGPSTPPASPESPEPSDSPDDQANPLAG